MRATKYVHCKWLAYALPDNLTSDKGVLTLHSKEEKYSTVKGEASMEPFHLIPYMYKHE